MRLTMDGNFECCCIYLDIGEGYLTNANRFDFSVSQDKLQCLRRELSLSSRCRLMNNAQIHTCRMAKLLNILKSVNTIIHVTFELIFISRWLIARTERLGGMLRKKRYFKNSELLRCSHHILYNLHLS
jgi:hypothetical protein